MGAANSVLERFLPGYNAQFARAAKQAFLSYRKLDGRLDLNYIFSLRYERVVGHDHVIVAIPGVKIQLPPLTCGRGYGRRKVEVCHQPDGSFHIYLDRRLLHIEAADPEAGPVRAHASRKSKSVYKKKPVAVCQLGGNVFRRGVTKVN